MKGLILTELNQNINSAIKALLDLTARIDERVKMLVESHADTQERIGEARDMISHLQGRMAILENKSIENDAVLKQLLLLREQNSRETAEILTRLKNVEGSSRTYEGHWKMAVDFVGKTIWTLFICYMLYKLNLQLPPVP